MQYREVVRVLADVTGSQWGLVTTAQAVGRGVSRLDLSRLATAGDLERLTQGVYKDSGAPATSHLDLRAAWLSTAPTQLAEDRLSERPASATVSGESAANLHGIGNFRAMQHEFTVAGRRQTQRPDIRYRMLELPNEDVTIQEGLPVTTIERTIADLVEARADLTLVANALADAARMGRIDVDRLVELLQPLAARNGHARGDGEALLKRLLELAGIDEAATAERIAALEGVGARVAASYFKSLPANAFGPGFDAHVMNGWAASITAPIAEQLRAAAWAGTAHVATGLTTPEREPEKSKP